MQSGTFPGINHSVKLKKSKKYDLNFKKSDLNQKNPIFLIFKKKS